MQGEVGQQCQHGLFTTAVKAEDGVTALVAVADLGGDAVVLTVFHAGDADDDLHLRIVVEDDGAGIYLHLIASNVFGYSTYESKWPVVEYYTNILRAGCYL